MKRFLPDFTNLLFLFTFFEILILDLDEVGRNDFVRILSDLQDN